jgi:hypothetical protein
MYEIRFFSFQPTFVVGITYCLYVGAELPVKVGQYRESQRKSHRHSKGNRYQRSVKDKNSTDSVL